MKNAKRLVYNIIRDDDDNNLAADIFDTAIILLIIVNVLLVILDTFQMPEWYRFASLLIERVSVGIFTAEYLLRIWTAPLKYPLYSPAKARLRYVVGFMAVVDLLSILPSYIPVIFPVDLRVLRLLRVIRLFRLFKVNRYTHALNTIQRVFQKKANQLVSSMFAIFLLIIIAAVLMYGVENNAQPGVFKNALDGLWWALATITNVDYSNYYPITTAGKLLSAVIALMGIGLIAVPTGIISAGFVEVVGEDGAAEDASSPLPAAELQAALSAYKALVSQGLISQADYEEKKRVLLGL